MLIAVDIEVHGRRDLHTCRVVYSTCDGRAVSCRRIRFAVGIVTPAHDRAVAPQGEAVMAAACNGFEIVANWNGRFTVVIRTPRNYGTVCLQGNSVIAAGGNGVEIVACGDITDLSLRVASARSASGMINRI